MELVLLLVFAMMGFTGNPLGLIFVLCIYAGIGLWLWERRAAVVKLTLVAIGILYGLVFVVNMSRPSVRSPQYSTPIIASPRPIAAPSVAPSTVSRASTTATVRGRAFSATFPIPPTIDDEKDGITAYSCGADDGSTDFYGFTEFAADRRQEFKQGCRLVEESEGHATPKVIHDNGVVYTGYRFTSDPQGRFLYQVTVEITKPSKASGYILLAEYRDTSAFERFMESLTFE